MEQQNYRKNKGGRPTKAERMKFFISVRCCLADKETIIGKAKGAHLTASEYLRSLGVNGKIDRAIKVFPKEALLMMGRLNHFCANVNQLAKKRNSGDELNAIERAELFSLMGFARDTVTLIRNYFTP